MALKISLARTAALDTNAELVAVGVPEGDIKRVDIVRALGKVLGATFAKLVKRGEFTGKKGQTLEVATAGVAKAMRVVLIGLGDATSLTTADVRRFAAKAARACLGGRAMTLAVAVPAGVAGGLRAAAEGVVLGAYGYEEYKTGDRRSKFPLERVSLLTPQSATGALRAEVALGQSVGESVCIARDLINMPPNDLYPEVLAARAVDMCKAHGLECRVLDDKALLAKGMKLLSAVGQGSARKPRFVHMTYKPDAKPGETVKKLVFVGKGLTFDTGGICLKPAPGMEEMKGDMGGAANVIALMAACSFVKPRAEVHGLIACAENMPDGLAYRPGDIFGSLDGKTVEIINTDAEGRLALADALAYGRELKPDFMLDNATLTGACVVALGPTVSGFYSGRDELADTMKRAADKAGEAMWRLPLVEDLKDQLKSDWADLKHMGDRWGGSITAALFLREFVGETPWIHVDIAGPSMATKAYDIYPKGGTGHGVLTYLALIDELTAGS
ncbi:MAG: leucyl aminopeptidase [Myxococcales bacterium]|nr:leucyl aminopeptidase [Myxococcales bacterium]